MRGERAAGRPPRNAILAARASSDIIAIATRFRTTWPSYDVSALA